MTREEIDIFIKIITTFQDICKTQPYCQGCPIICTCLRFKYEDYPAHWRIGIIEEELKEVFLDERQGN